MKSIESLNKQLKNEEKEIEIMIEELVEKQEYACTGDGCGVKGCGVN